MAYDRQTRSMLQTAQPRPDLGSQSGTVKTSPDGSTDIYFGPTAPDGRTSNWLQTVPGKGRMVRALPGPDGITSGHLPAGSAVAPGCR